ncbi:MAG: hypothetical protein ACK55Z_00480, partial [bacterium]
QLQVTSVRAASALTASQQQSSNHHHHNYHNYSSKQIGLLAAAGATTLAATAMNEKSNAKCCGIVGVVGAKDGSARDFLIEGLTILKNRGYDSAGIATMPEKDPSL